MFSLPTIAGVILTPVLTALALFATPITLTFIPDQSAHLEQEAAIVLGVLVVETTVALVTIRHALTNDRLCETAAFAAIGVIEGFRLDLFPKGKCALGAALVPLAYVSALYVKAVHIISVDGSRRDNTGPLFSSCIATAQTLLGRAGTFLHSMAGVGGPRPQPEPISTPTPAPTTPPPHYHDMKDTV
ncbi:hypothetical protein FB451DRAFT_91638 [Mycena latifolia]|nr:hypothetical protein FB451DRAFT_91638 [Mycena latifolia]